MHSCLLGDSPKLLSKPYLLVMDREKGSINVGQNVPFLASTETSNNGSLVQKIERQNVVLEVEENNGEGNYVSC